MGRQTGGGAGVIDTRVDKNRAKDNIHIRERLRSLPLNPFRGTQCLPLPLEGGGEMKGITCLTILGFVREIELTFF